MQSDPVRRRVVVNGHVQGVFFRDSARRRARTEGVSGSIRNRPDGAVEAVLEGQRDAVERIVEFLRTGPSQARVDHIEVHEEQPEGLTGFAIR